MSHIATRDQLGDTEDLTRAMLECGKGRPVAQVAQAALDIALGLWALSEDVTREMALKVVTAQIDNRFKARSN